MPAQQSLPNGTNGIQSQDTAGQSINAGPPGTQNSATEPSTSQFSTSYTSTASQPVFHAVQEPVMGSTADQNSDAATPAKRLIKVKMEDGTVFGAQEGALRTLLQAAASSTSGATNAVGLNFDGLKHIIGISTIGIMNQKHRISSDPSKLSQDKAKSTMSMAGLEYHVAPVNIAPPLIVSEPANVDVDRQDEEDAEMAVTLTKIKSPSPCPLLTRADFIFGFTALFQITSTSVPPPASFPQLSSPPPYHNPKPFSQPQKPFQG